MGARARRAPRMSGSANKAANIFFFLSFLPHPKKILTLFRKKGNPMKKMEERDKSMTYFSEESDDDPGTPTDKSIRDNALRIFKSIQEELKKDEAPIGGEMKMRPELQKDGSLKLNTTYTPKNRPPDGEAGVLV